MKKTLALSLILAMAMMLVACFGRDDKETTAGKETETTKDMETDRETIKETERETQKETNRETEKETNRETNQETNRETNPETNTETRERAVRGYDYDSSISTPKDNVNNPANTSPMEQNFWGAGNDDGFEGSWLIQ